MRPCGSLKRYTAVFLAILSALVLSGCNNEIKPGPNDVVVIGDNTPVPATAAPTPDASLTPEPTEIPTDTPAPTEAMQNPTGRVIYLTFDDGPYKYTDEVLDILASYNIKATFFTIGEQIQRYPEQAKRIAAEGHCLACHTQSHEMDICYKSVDAFVGDIAKWRQTVINAVGYDAGAYVLRFPGGTTNTTIGGRKGRDPFVSAANNAGYKVFDWNMGINDRWLAGNTEGLPKIDYFWKSYLETYALFKNTTPLILIIHDTEPVSVELLPRIIEDLLAKGFSFGTLDQVNNNYLM
ncbi:MAG: polysaccharide deacetylase family protein [Clostridia bacterium]|nr:polysaccharide deacetylase family protein [Clostridia bacterium]